MARSLQVFPPESSIGQSQGDLLRDVLAELEERQADHGLKKSDMFVDILKLHHGKYASNPVENVMDLPYR